MLKVVNDIQSEIKKNNLSVILMLDLSAAFDTIDQTRLLNKLEACFFIRGNALKFIESYIKGRTYSVFLNGKSSNRCQLDYGVPQGSILGPKLFSMYIQDVEEIAIAHRIEIHSYADDTNLYLGFKPMGEFGASMEKIEGCLNEIQLYMRKNFLKINVSKTQVLFCGSPNQLSLYESRFSELYSALDIDISDSTVLQNAKTLGLVIDQKLKFDDMISDIVKGAYFKLNKLKTIRNSLNEKTRISLVKCYVLTKLDYCNFVFANASNKQIYRLQKCMNSAVRFIYDVRKSSSITPYLKQAHFLPVKYRIKYKLNFYAYKILNGKAPLYMSTLIVRRTPNRNLRSADDETLLETSCQNGTLAYRVCTEWNALPRSLRENLSLTTFKTTLKTHYFRIAFEL